MCKVLWKKICALLNVFHDLGFLTFMKLYLSNLQSASSLLTQHYIIYLELLYTWEHWMTTCFQPVMWAKFGLKQTFLCPGFLPSIA